MHKIKIIFCFPEKAKPKTKKNNDDFRKVVIYNKMQEIKIIFCFPEKKAKQKK